MDLFNMFLLTGTVFFCVQIIKFMWFIWEVYSMNKDIRLHDQYCEDCADDLMAETFKSMRGDKDERR